MSGDHRRIVEERRQARAERDEIRYQAWFEVVWREKRRTLESSMPLAGILIKLRHQRAPHFAAAKIPQVPRYYR